MKLDRYALENRTYTSTFPIDSNFDSPCSDGSGSIDREEFLQIPAIANNPLASRLIAIFDEEYVAVESRATSADF